MLRGESLIIVMQPASTDYGNRTPHRMRIAPRHSVMRGHLLLRRGAVDQVEFLKGRPANPGLLDRARVRLSAVRSALGTAASKERHHDITSSD
jgi:hypothetical protein